MSHEPPPPAGSVDDCRVLVAEEWRRRSRAEYVSSAIAQQITLWLTQAGAPPDLLADGIRVGDDELTHSRMAAGVADAVGVVTAPAVVGRAALELAAGPDPMSSLLPPVLRYLCIGETVAVPLFRMLREPCSAAPARAALDRVLRDEPRHRRFGWDVLDWLLLLDEPAALAAAHRAVPAMVAEFRAAYGCAVGEPSVSMLDPEVARWGLASPDAYATTVSVAFARDVLPRFAARGIVADP